LDNRSRLHLAVSNQHGSEVVAFLISDGDGEVIQEFLAPSSRISSGATYDFVISDRTKDLSAYSLKAVLFGDGSAQGSREDLLKIDAIRAGRLYRLLEATALLEGLRNSSDADFTDRLDKAMVQLALKDTYLKDGTKAKGLFANGLRSANSILLEGLKQTKDSLQNDAPTARESLESVITNHKAVVDHLDKTNLRLYRKGEDHAN
jgi:hypothetical protein